MRHRIAFWEKVAPHILTKIVVYFYIVYFKLDRNFSCCLHGPNKRRALYYYLLDLLFNNEIFDVLTSNLCLRNAFCSQGRIAFKLDLFQFRLQQRVIASFAMSNDKRITATILVFSLSYILCLGILHLICFNYY